MDTDLAVNDAICFHCQQCAEKYLKAILVERNVPFRKTHNLVALVDLLNPTDIPDFRY